ncbi:AMP-binding enzyme [Microbulbifer taiwanensis]|uniref:AMP-binding enzyme n=1 Tax=Microbulbifer taiwanensis TaxID=986746 RepID=UPI003605CE2B
MKIRGFRVEPAEVEAALLDLPGVRQAAVIARDAAGAAELAAFVVTDGGEMPRREQLADRLPAQMLPAQLVAVADLPRLPSGKIDRRALAELAAAGQGQRQKCPRPRPAAPNQPPNWKRPCAPLWPRCWDANAWPQTQTFSSPAATPCW